MTHGFCARDSDVKRCLSTWMLERESGIQVELPAATDKSV